MDNVSCPHWLPIRSEILNYTNLLLYIAIGTSPPNSIIRDAIRNTWIQWQNCGNYYVDYQFFTESTTATETEKRKYKDISFVTSTSGYGDFVQRWFHQMKWITDHFSPKFILRVDDDGVLCLPHIIHNLQHLPTQKFFWGKYFCEQGKYTADENFMLFSSDLIKWFINSKHALYISPVKSATFASHFGLWQHFLNITILDDRTRIDAQQAYTTSYMHDKQAKQENLIHAKSFCHKHIWAHHVKHTKLFFNAFNDVEWKNVLHPPITTQKLGICDGKFNSVFEHKKTHLRSDEQIPDIIYT